MTQKEAIEYLSDGHTIWTVKCAKEICESINVPFDQKLVRKFKSDPPGTLKGLTMNEGQENSSGVDALTLSAYVASKLDVEKEAGDYFGRGKQARAYAEVVAKKLGIS